MSKLIAALKLVALILPLLRQMAVAAESALPDGTPGDEKAKIVRAWIERAIALEEGATASIDGVWPFIKPVLDVLIPAMRAKGELPPKATAT